MPGSTLEIIKLSVDNTENSKRSKLILVYCKVFRKFQNFCQKIDQSKVFDFKKINTLIIFSKNKQFTKNNTRKILK